MRKVCAFLLGTIVVGMPGHLSAQQTISADELLERLDRARTLAEAGMADPSSESMTQLRRTVELPARVEVGGWTGWVPVDPILEGLSGEEPEDFERALARVEALHEAVGSVGAVEPLDPHAVERAVDAAYRGAIQVRPGLAERIRRAVSELFQGLAYRLFTFVGAGTVLAWAVLAALVMGALWLLLRLRLVPQVALREAGKRSLVGPADWSRRAEEAIGAGDLREAVRALYAGLLATLAGRGYVVEAPGRTAGECRAAVRGGPATLSEVVGEATESFEGVAYGGRAPEARDVAVLRRAHDLARSA